MISLIQWAVFISALIFFLIIIIPTVDAQIDQQTAFQPQRDTINNDVENMLDRADNALNESNEITDRFESAVDAIRMKVDMLGANIDILNIILEDRDLGDAPGHLGGQNDNDIRWGGPWSPDTYASGDYPRLGDPLIVSLNGKACTNTIHYDQHESFKTKFDLLAIGHDIHLARELCEGSYYIMYDNGDEFVDGWDMLFSFDLNAYDVLSLIDPQGADNFYLADNDFNMYPFYGLKQIHYANPECFENDAHGQGVYADQVGASTQHFRIYCHLIDGAEMQDGTFLETFAIVQGGLEDCTVNDIGYATAEINQRTNSFEKAWNLYKTGYERCEDAGRDSAIWIAGMGSVYHRVGVIGENPDHLEKALDFYEIALMIDPDYEKVKEDMDMIGEQNQND